MQRSDLCVNLGVTVWRGLPPVHRDKGSWRWVGTQGSLTLSFPLAGHEARVMLVATSEGTSFGLGDF